MFSIVRCEMCGRVFPHYRGRKFTPCANKLNCGANVTFTNDTVLLISYDIGKIDEHELIVARKNKSFPAYINKAIVFVNVFNNNAFLAAQVFSEDGLNSITVSLNEKYLGITRDDVFKCIPEGNRYQLSRDGSYCFSGRYPLTEDLKTKINGQLYKVVNNDKKNENYEDRQTGQPIVPEGQDPDKNTKA